LGRIIRNCCRILLATVLSVWQKEAQLDSSCQDPLYEQLSTIDLLSKIAKRGRIEWAIK